VNETLAAACVALLVGGCNAPTAPGVAFVLAQAAVVAVFTVLQALALKRC
jgi:hypothetical protein